MNKAEALSNFQAFTAISNESEARQLLEAAGWNVERAANLFFENGAVSEPIASISSGTNRKRQRTANDAGTSRGEVVTLSDDDDDDLFETLKKKPANGKAPSVVSYQGVRPESNGNGRSQNGRRGKSPDVIPIEEVAPSGGPANGGPSSSSARTNPLAPIFRPAAGGNGARQRMGHQSSRPANVQQRQPAQGNADQADPDFVRAPINVHRSGPIVNMTYEQQYGVLNGRRAPMSAFSDGLVTDAKTIVERQRAALLAGASSSEAARAGSGTRDLKAMFASPIEMCFIGDWEGVREEAQRRGRWLLVNVQDHTEFACSTLNRDVWSNGGVRELVRANFTFYQPYIASADGQRLKNYYHLKTFPAIFIVDPRTGELVFPITLRKQDPISMCDFLTQFIDDFPDFAARDRATIGNRPGVITKRKETPEPQPTEENPRKRKNAKSEEAEEKTDDDSQAEDKVKRKRMDEDDLEALQHLSIQQPAVGISDWTAHVAPTGTPVIIALKFADKRETVQLTSDTKLNALYVYIAGRNFIRDKHTFVMQATRIILYPEDADKTLGDLGFSSRDVVHVDDYVRPSQ